MADGADDPFKSVEYTAALMRRHLELAERRFFTADAMEQINIVVELGLRCLQANAAARMRMASQSASNLPQIDRFPYAGVV